MIEVDYTIRGMVSGLLHFPFPAITREPASVKGMNYASSSGHECFSGISSQTRSFKFMPPHVLTLSHLVDDPYKLGFSDIFQLPTSLRWAAALHKPRPLPSGTTSLSTRPPPPPLLAMSAAPLRLARLASLSMLFAFGIIGMGVGINALVKFNDQKREIKRLVSGGATVNIDTNDVLSSGIVLTVVCGLLAASSLLFLVPLFVATAFGARTLGVQTGILGFLSVWLFATLVPFTDFFANHQAKVTAFFGSITIPQSTIQQIEASMGATSVYRHIDYRTSILSI